mmetsp:Transcript_11203/g.23449  ORF Transcript_11203/g.23449 Transcript_11203/m.23449 type:complete len:242 (-) Transcript_11203:184-909(-)
MWIVVALVHLLVVFVVVVVEEEGRCATHPWISCQPHWENLFPLRLRSIAAICTFVYRSNLRVERRRSMAISLPRLRRPMDRPRRTRPRKLRRRRTRHHLLPPGVSRHQKRHRPDQQRHSGPKTAAGALLPRSPTPGPLRSRCRLVASLVAQFGIQRFAFDSKSYGSLVRGFECRRSCLEGAGREDCQSEGEARSETSSGVVGAEMRGADGHVYYYIVVFLLCLLYVTSNTRVFPYFIHIPE